MAHELWLFKGKTMTNITPLVGTIGRRGNKDELGEEITFDVVHGKNIPKNPCKLGDMVILKNGKKEITRAIIVDEDKGSGVSVNYTAFDPAFYFNKSNAVYQFKKMAADKCIAKIARDFDVPIGHLTSIRTTIDKIYNDKPVSDIIKDILSTVRKKTGNKYTMEMRAGSLYIFHKYSMTIKATFKLNGKSYNVADAISNPSRKRSIAEMINTIQVVDSKGKVVLKKTDSKMQKKYGHLQKVVQLDEKEKRSAKQIAQNELKEFSKVTVESSVELIGNDNIRDGRILELNEPTTGIKGKYLIKSADHTITGGIHKVQVELEGL